MSRKSTVNAHFQAETEAMEKIFKGSLNLKTSTTQLQKWVGQAIAETLTLGIWSIQYETESAAINDCKGGD
jgi:hypothetical protein